MGPGSGRRVLTKADTTITEIICQARGAALFACEQIEPGRRGRDE